MPSRLLVGNQVTRRGIFCLAAAAHNQQLSTTTRRALATATTTTLSQQQRQHLPPLETSPLSGFLSFPSLTMAPPLSAHTPLRVGQRLVVIGDVHGDLQALHRLLQLAELVDETDTWAAGDTIVVQCGDIMDRGGQELACWQVLCRLSHQAVAKGGAVNTLWGNHEILNAIGLFHYTTGNEFEQRMGKPLDLHTPFGNAWRRQFAGNQPARWAACEPGGILAHGLWAHLSVALVVGRTLCVHAGLKNRHLGHPEEGGNLATLNQQAREWITTVHHGQNYNMALPSEEPDAIIALANARARAASRSLPACLGGRGAEATSPVWMRDYSGTPTLNAKASQDLDAVLNRVSASRMVMGHTPQEQINAAANGKAWRVDIAASRGMGGGTPQVLEIIHGAVHDEIYVLTEQGRVPSEERIVG